MQNEGPVIHREMVNDLPFNLDIHKSVELDVVHPRVLGEVAEELTEPSSVIYRWFWLAGEVLSDWELAVVTPICKKGQKEGLGSYRPVCLILVLDNVMPQVITSVIIWHMQDNQRDQVQPV